MLLMAIFPKTMLIQSLKRRVETLGNIDILINSAGVSDVIMSTVDQEVETWQRIIDNLTGAFLASQPVAPDMLKRKWMYRECKLDCWPGWFTSA